MAAEEWGVDWQKKGGQKEGGDGNHEFHEGHEWGGGRGDK